jgi:hypothetical protein
MKELVDWVLARRYALISFAVIFAPNLSFVSAGLLALQTAHRGPVVAIGDALLAALGVAVVTVLAGGSAAMPLAASVTLTMGVIVGGAIRYFRSFTLTFQAIVLCAYVLVLGYSLFGSTSNVLFDSIMDQILEIMRAQGASAGALAEQRLLQPRLVGVFAISILSELIVVLILAYWWLSLAREEVKFGEEFRALRIGYVLGVPGALICFAVLVFDGSLVHNLFGVAACAFLLQGLAYAHRWAFAHQWHAVYLLPVYVLLVPMLLLFSAVVIGLYPF